MPACGAGIVPADLTPDGARASDAAVSDGADDRAAPDGAVDDATPDDGGRSDAVAVAGPVVPGRACSDELYVGSVGRAWSAELLRLGEQVFVVWTPPTGGVAFDPLQEGSAGPGRRTAWAVPVNVSDTVHTAAWIDRGVVGVGARVALVRADETGAAVLGVTHVLEGRSVRGVGLPSEPLARVALDNGALGFVSATGANANHPPEMGLAPGASVSFTLDGYTAWTPTADGEALTARTFVVGHGATLELDPYAATLRGRSASRVQGGYRVVQEGAREVSLRLEALSEDLPPTARATGWRAENVAWITTTAAVRPAEDGAVMAWAAHPTGGAANSEVHVAWSEGGPVRAVTAAREGTNTRVLDVMSAGDGTRAWVLYAGALQGREGLFARCVRRIP